MGTPTPGTIVGDAVAMDAAGPPPAAGRGIGPELHHNHGHARRRHPLLGPGAPATVTEIAVQAVMDAAAVAVV